MNGVLVYDGACSFCRLWVEHWHQLTGDEVHYAPSQAAAGQYPQIAPEQFARAVQLILPDGTVYSGAQAVFYLLKDTPNRGWMLWLYQHIPGFGTLSELVYRLIAAHRNLFYWLTIILWGHNLGPHRYVLSRWLFLRVLGLIYLVAFLSLAVQIRGLIGSQGILPITEYLQRIAAVYPTPDRYVAFPTLVWINSSDAFLQALCIGGALLAVLLILDIATIPALALLWLLYLSLFNAGQDFLGFQWDILLLEVGFLAIFLDSFHILPRLSRQRSPSLVVIWLFRLLLFRLMFMSGVVKLASGDPTWRNLTALDYHFWTQPLPTPLAWYMAQLPPTFLQLATAFTFFVELICPFLFFLPRRLRMIGASLTILLQLIILLTGNYTFFNYLAIALCILMFDDDALRHLFPRRMREMRLPRPSRIKQIIAVPLALVLIFVGGEIVLNLVDSRISPSTLPPPLASIYNRATRLYLVNGYGLFAVMTTTRPEIIVEGSNDGKTWLPYEFPYKAGDVNRSPVYVAPYQPRLDWQMWFAALGQNYQSNPWFVNFVYRLLQGSPDVLALLADNPFPDKPPTYIRAVLYQYRFTTADQRGATGAWWTRTQVGDYLPSVSLNDFSATP
ncbi:MAG TPA: lipase maturation factor family protein [Phototrophicaceae bacterium]|nr:lipase maturation factor family protein [Phototrophicaceae bacterium]